MREGIPEDHGLRALELAGRSAFELDCLLSHRPAPDWATLEGRWHGINKGVGAAVLGYTQDIKVFVTSGPCPYGYNLAVHQVSLDDLACRGFRPELDPLTGRAKRMGNFKIIVPDSNCQPLRLDYSLAANDWHDPSKRLVDDVVMIDEGLLLGRASIKIGSHLMPIAYFVLSRAQHTECDASDSCAACDELVIDR
ncbi:MAG: hypothetical protein IT423_24430 [Pirellulaceae bacterium]|nr:hypothetical protein [Pirellulaceae bacterium]